MQSNPTTPLAPLDPQVIAHLTATLGPPKPVFMDIQGGKDIYADCWLVGRGRIEAGDARRYTEVKIWLTPGGTLITNRSNGTVDGSFIGTGGTGCAHSSPESAYQWLLKDGKGKLGPVSKEAWVKACRNVPPMAGMEYERVD